MERADSTGRLTVRVLCGSRPAVTPAWETKTLAARPDAIAPDGSDVRILLGVAGGGLAFAALAGISLLQSAAHPYTALVYAVGRPGVAVRALAAALLVDGVVAVALVPLIGIWGAVAANAAGALAAICLAARAALGRRSVRRAGVPVARLATIAFAAAACSLAAGAAAARIHPALGAIAAYAVGAALFAVAARVTGGVVAESDAAVIRRALPARVAALLA
jgi:O-antigen/teichoic acid export membrane protein